MRNATYLRITQSQVDPPIYIQVTLTELSIRQKQCYNLATFILLPRQLQHGYIWLYTVGRREKSAAERLQAVGLWVDERNLQLNDSKQ